jgi:thioredoxin 2
MSAKRGVDVTCPSCRKHNRIPYGRLAATATCGACKAALPHYDRPVELMAEEEFEAILKEARVPVLVDYWAPWCGPCRMVAPELEKVARSRAGGTLVLKVNTDRFPNIGARQGIRSIPTMAVYMDGREIGRTAGARPAPQIERYLDEQVAAAV